MALLSLLVEVYATARMRAAARAAFHYAALLRRSFRFSFSFFFHTLRRRFRFLCAACAASFFDAAAAAAISDFFMSLSSLRVY